MSGEADRADIEGRVVIVGPSASRLAGEARTIVGSMSHALFQALAVDTILGHRTVTRPPFMAPVEVVVAIALGLVLVVAGPWLALPGIGRAAVVVVVTLTAGAAVKIGRAHVSTPVPNPHL